MPKVLIVEDDPTIRTAVTRALTGKGYAVAAAHTAMSGLQLAVSEHPDVVVLDLGLPDLDGREVLRMIRAVSKVPIIVATSRGTEEDIVRSLDAGADDYVVKPYGGAQLDARIRAVLRRSAGPAEEPVIEVGGLRVDRKARRATLDGGELDLTPREFDLLHYLAARAGTVVTKQELLVKGLAATVRRRRQVRRCAPVLAAPQARRVGDRAQVPADGAQGRRPAVSSRRAGASCS
jgi:DNA-binding response OmpR family regulator